MPRNQRRRVPVQARAWLKYQAVLGAVPRVLKREGYAGTTTDKIAVEAEVPIGTLYQYFQDKDAIIASYLDQELERVMTSVDGAATPEPGVPLRSIIRTLVGAGVSFVLANREIIHAAVHEVPGFLSAAPIQRAEQRISDVAGALSSLMGQTNSGDPVRLVSYVLTNAVFGFFLRSVVDLPPDISRDEISDQIVKLFTGYLELSGVDLDRSF